MAPSRGGGSAPPASVAIKSAGGAEPPPLLDSPQGWRVVKQRAAQQFAHGSKALAVNRRWAMLAQRGQVGRRAIAFVPRETVSGILFMQLHHQTVAGNFGNDRGGGNGEAQRIAMD